MQKLHRVTCFSKASRVDARMMKRLASSSLSSVRRRPSLADQTLVWLGDFQPPAL